MVNKILGYVLALLGLGGLVVSSVKVSFINISSIPKKFLLVGSLALIILGVIFSISKKEKSHKEVPIYHGKEIVGYRRH